MRKLITSLGVSLLLILGGLSQVQPAQAASVGPAGYITFWDGCTGGSSSNHTVGYCGAAWPEPQTRTLNTCYALTSGENDRWSAFSNNTGHNWKVYTAGGCTGSVATLYAGTETGQIDSPFNNSISSYRRVS